MTAFGCDIVRVACPSQDDADALPAIARKSQIPVIADIHFQPKYVYAAIEAGCAAVRVNPGNIRQFDDQVKQIAKEAKEAGVSIRIGVNAGSLDKRLLEKYASPPPRLWWSRGGRPACSEEHDFHDFKISVKHNDPVVMVRAYEMFLSPSVVTAAAPRRHRGRTGVPGHDQVSHRVRCAAVQGHRRHHLASLLGPSRGGGQSATRHCSRSTSSRASLRSCPALVRPRPGGRL